MSKFVAKRPKLSLSFPLSSLPEEVALSCLARVSKSDLAALCLVSKKYHSLVTSPEFYKLRSQLGYTTYTRFYVCLSPGHDSTPSWYMFSREKNEINSRRIMSLIPSFPSQLVHGSSVVALDWEIYVIGGSVINNENNCWKRTSVVLRLDCRTHTWCQVPSMRVACYGAGAGVVDGKIYVFGGCKESEYDSLSYGEVFDPKTQTWDNFSPLPDSNQSKGFNNIRESFVMEGKVFALSNWVKIFYYSPCERRWERKGMIVEDSRIGSYCCVSEKLLYGCGPYGNVFWYESEKFEWKEVKGLEALQKIFPEPRNRGVEGYSRYTSYIEVYPSKLRRYGANVMIFWAKYNFNDKIVDVWCAEISFERREEKNEIWGTIEWSEVVATLDYEPLHKVEVLYSASVNV